MSDQDLSLTPNQEVILSALRFRKRYGLEIMEAIEKSGGKQIGFNSLYPNLKKLEKKGFVKSEWGEEPPEEHTGARRKYYRITGIGVKALEVKQQLLECVAHWTPEPKGV
ncbi:MAG: helix-turn-helix transcriptional regulator [Symploca sp. SIO3C6]|uniref:Helix-turn-helix transcriptional regulator n=1 Tax=Symploca sp. SIO1C4 TaxID=2607765 RepID=A0A6B3NIJ1_9CYAN|nr:helix-turn-helix transcriptional regulator [Symploca sp. SIO3C6]NER29481.1 helix-turn-helix transcriptional regulator [Symploca sp. SIO1C4]NET03452.1 helix-turn-helix transcriptional regulator [Symploca sp. SIO2B6]NET54595.1 helix-turn-helix transcriptional regulator [Merismopedia sp. SIO2A8]